MKPSTRTIWARSSQLTIAVAMLATVLLINPDEVEANPSACSPTTYQRYLDGYYSWVKKVNKHSGRCGIPVHIKSCTVDGSKQSNSYPDNKSRADCRYCGHTSTVQSYNRSVWLSHRPWKKTFVSEKNSYRCNWYTKNLEYSVHILTTKRDQYPYTALPPNSASASSDRRKASTLPVELMSVSVKKRR